MNRKILTILFISFISVCLVVGFLGRAAIAASNEPSRGADAWERYTQRIGGQEQTFVRQYTSQYDLMRGEYYPEMNLSYSGPNWGAMMNPFAPVYESSYEASGTGGYFTGPMMRWPVSPLSYMMGSMGSPQVQMYESAGPYSGSMSYSSIYPGLGLGVAGFMLGPFSFGGYGAAGGAYSGGWGGMFAGFGGGYGGYGVGSYPGGGYPTRIF